MREKIESEIKEMSRTELERFTVLLWYRKNKFLYGARFCLAMSLVFLGMTVTVLLSIIHMSFSFGVTI